MLLAEPIIVLLFQKLIVSVLCIYQLDLPCDSWHIFGM